MKMLRKQLRNLTVLVMLVFLSFGYATQANAGAAGLLAVMMNKKLAEERKRASVPEIEPDGFLLLFEWVLGEDEIRICDEEQGKTIVSKRGGCYERKMVKSKWTGTNTFEHTFVNDGTPIQELIDNRFGKSNAKLFKVEITGVGSSKRLMAYYKLTEKSE